MKIYYDNLFNCIAYQANRSRVYTVGISGRWFLSCVTNAERRPDRFEFLGVI